MFFSRSLLISCSADFAGQAERPVPVHSASRDAELHVLLYGPHDALADRAENLHPGSTLLMCARVATVCTKSGRCCADARTAYRVLQVVLERELFWRFAQDDRCDPAKDEGADRPSGLLKMISSVARFGVTRTPRIISGSPGTVRPAAAIRAGTQTGGPHEPTHRA